MSRLPRIQKAIGVVKLPSGLILSRVDLPKDHKARWTKRMKAAVAHGLISAGEAQQLYCLSEEELSSWEPP